MSNRATIQTTEFHNVPGGEVTKGFRMYDDYGQAYDNTWDDIPDDDMEILKRVAKSDDETIIVMFDSIVKNKKGIFINNNWYDWEQISDILVGQSEEA